MLCGRLCKVRLTAIPCWALDSLTLESVGDDRSLLSTEGCLGLGSSLKYEIAATVRFHREIILDSTFKPYQE